MRGKKSEKGQVLILFAFGIVVLIGLTALAVDGGNAYLDRRKAQNAAETAAMAAASAKIQGGDLGAAGRSRAASNGYNNNGTTNTVVVNNDPGTACGITPQITDDPTQYIQVVINTNVNTYFASAVGVGQTHNCVQSIVKVAGSYGGEAMMAMSKTDSCAINLTGSGAITVHNGSMWGNSSSASPAGMCLTGSGGISADSIQLCHIPARKTGSGSITPTPTLCPGQIDDPYPSLTPPADPGGACPSISYTGSTSHTINPGCYSGISQTGSGNLTLNSGIYYLKSGNFSITGSGNVSAVKVLIYVKTGSVSLTGSGNLTLTAQTSGPYAGMALYMDRSNSSSISMTGSGGTVTTGTFYAPASIMTLTGSGSSTHMDSQLIARNIRLTGSGTITMDYHSNSQFGSPMIQFYQ